MFKRKLSILIWCVLASIAVRAQYDVSFSHYFDMEPSFNPAAVGKDAKLNVVGAYALDFAGFEHNPQTMYLAADMPFYGMKTYHGVGAQLMSDKIGLFNHQRLSAQYALKHKLAGGVISYGVQVGLLSENLDGSKADFPEQNTDPAFSSSEVTGTGIDVAAGLYYTHKRWYVGVSAQHLTAPLVKLGELNELQIDRTYYLTGGYNIKLRNQFLTIHPSFLVRTDMKAYRGDITSRLVYRHENKMLYAGASYSPGNSVTALIGGSFHGIVVGYSYEVYTSAINIGNGSHELFVSYQTDINLTKRGKNRHQSPRIL